MAAHENMVKVNGREPQRQLENNREATNRVSLYMFGLMVASWVTAVFYAILASPSNNSLEPNHDDNMDKPGRSVVMMTTVPLFSITLMLFYILTLKYLSKGFVVLSVILIGVMTGLTLVAVVMIFIHIGEMELARCFQASTSCSPIIAIFMIFPFIFLYYAALLLSIKKTTVRVIRKAVKECLQAICQNYLLLPLSLLFLLFKLLALSFSFTALSSNLKPILFVLIIVQTLIVFLFLTYVENMIIAYCIGNWYWTNDKSEISRGIILRGVVNIYRYHLGSAAYAASILPPLVIAIIQAFKWKHNPGTKRENWLIRLVCKIRLVFEVSDFASIQTATRGHNFVDSAKRAFYYLLHNCSLYLAVLDVFYTLISIAYFVISLIVMLWLSPLLGYPSYGHSDLTPLGATITFALSPFYSVMGMAIKTILTCKAEKSRALLDSTIP